MLFEYKKNKNNRELKFLGIKIYEYNSDYLTDKRYQKFLFGLIKTLRRDNFYKNYSIKIFKFLNIPFIKRVDKGNERKYYFFNILIKKDKISAIFKRRYFHLINGKADSVFVLNSNSGEVCLFLMYAIDVLIKRDNIKKPLIIATKKYHIDLIKLICPEIPFIYIGKIRPMLKADYFNIEDIKFYTIFTYKHFLETELDIKNDRSAHYFKSILNHSKINENEIKQRKIKIPDEFYNSLYKKIRKTSLDLNNFVFISPEAASCVPVDNEFWINLIKNLNCKGVSVFVNQIKNDSGFEQSDIHYINTPLSFGEAVALAYLSKRIITLRSGINECLIQANVPTEVYYTSFKPRPVLNDMKADDVKRGFSLLNLCEQDNKIKEYIFENC